MAQRKDPPDRPSYNLDALRRKLSKPVQTSGAAHPPGPSRPSNSVTVSEREESQYNEVYVIGA